MPCHVRSSSVSRRRRIVSPSGLLLGHPKPAALLDLSKPGERFVERFMRWAATGPVRCGRRWLWRDGKRCCSSR